MLVAAILMCFGDQDSPRSTLSAEPPRADDLSRAKQVTIYDSDSAHLWNRLHRALFVRTTSEGIEYGRDELDPLLWPESKFLLVGEHHKHVICKRRANNRNTSRCN